MINKSIKRGFGFGITSGIITTLGMIVGLNAATNSEVAVIGGILTIAVADSLSDAFGIHISEEYSSKRSSSKGVWQSTFSTFFAKLFFALTFLVPFIIFSLSSAILVSILWGLSLITLFSYYLAKKKNSSMFKTISEHLAISIFVIVATNFLGKVISLYF